MVKAGRAGRCFGLSVLSKKQFRKKAEQLELVVKQPIGVCWALPRAPPVPPVLLAGVAAGASTFHQRYVVLQVRTGVGIGKGRADF